MAKICIVGPSVKYFSGISAYTIRVANALSASNDVSVLLLRDMLPRLLYPGKYNVDRLDHSVTFLPGIKTFDGLDWNSPSSWIGACRFLKQERPDVIIMQWWTSAVAHLELFLALVNRWKIKSGLILEMHEVLDPLETRSSPLRLYSRVAGRMIMNGGAAFIVHSAHVREQAIRAYHLKEDRVFVIPHGVYDSYFRENVREAARKELGISSEFALLYFGMIRRYKGLPCLMEAFDRLPPSVAEDSRLIIVGEDWGDEKGLDALVRSSPYNQRIIFRPKFVPEFAVSSYFSAADVVVLPYTRTSGSGVASLAMAYGKPVIVSDLEDTRDALEDYGGAVFVQACDSASLAACIVDVYTQQRTYRVSSYAVPSRLTWPCIVSQYAEIVEKVKR